MIFTEYTSKRETGVTEYFLYRKKESTEFCKI